VSLAGALIAYTGIPKEFFFMFPKSWTNTATVLFPQPVNVVLYIVLWVICLALVYFILRRGRALGFARWTTQDILVVAILAVLLEVYDNLIGDQFITPLINLVPLGHAFALNDLPYMFLLMTGIALVRKPGAATAMVFLNYLLMQLFYNSSGVNILMWQYGLMQGLFVDLYFVLRGTRVFTSASAVGILILDGFFMGALRAIPADTVQSFFLGPFIQGQTRTLGYIFFYSLFNMIGNGIEAAISAPLAVRIARSVNPSANRTAPIRDTTEPGTDTPVVPERTSRA
jgi:hypothetical protein